MRDLMISDCRPRRESIQLQSQPIMHHDSELRPHVQMCRSHWYLFAILSRRSGSFERLYCRSAALLYIKESSPHWHYPSESLPRLPYSQPLFPFPLPPVPHPLLTCPRQPSTQISHQLETTNIVRAAILCHPHPVLGL